METLETNLTCKNQTLETKNSQSHISIQSQDSKIEEILISGTPKKQMTFKDLIATKRVVYSPQTFPNYSNEYKHTIITDYNCKSDKNKELLDYNNKTAFKKKINKIKLPKLVTFNEMIDNNPHDDDTITEYEFLRDKPLDIPKRAKQNFDIEKLIEKCKKEKQDKVSYLLAKNVLTESDPDNLFVIEAPEKLEGFITKKPALDPREKLREKFKKFANDKRTEKVSQDMIFCKSKTELNGKDTEILKKHSDGEIPDYVEDQARPLPKKYLCTKINEKLRKAADMYKNEIRLKTRNGKYYLDEWHKELSDIDLQILREDSEQISSDSSENISLKRKRSISDENGLKRPKVNELVTK